MEVEKTVTGQELEHVIEETEAGGHDGLAGAVQPQPHHHLRLPGVALHGGRPFSGLRFLRLTFRVQVFLHGRIAVVR